LAFLKEEDEQPIEIIDYLKNPPSVAQIKELLHKLGIPPIDLVRKKEAIWKEVGSDSLTDTQIIELLHQYPKLIERPILIQGDKAIIARPISGSARMAQTTEKTIIKIILLINFI